MTKRLLLLILAYLFLIPTSTAIIDHKEGRKQIRIIKEQLKGGKASEALNTTESLLKDSCYKWNPQLLQYAVDACRILNDKENEKFYLNSKPDTTVLFTTTYNLINYILLTDSAERRMTNFDKDKVIKYRFRKGNKDIIYRVYHNFITAPRYFIARGKTNEAQLFSDLAIQLALSPIMQSYRQERIDQSVLTDLATINVMACYREHKYNDIERYINLALRDSVKREGIYEMLAYCAIERGDTMSYRQRLLEGHHNFPGNMFFYTRLVDYNLHKGDNDAVLTASDRTLQHLLTDSTSRSSEQIAQIYEARAIAYFNSGNQRLCIENAEKILSYAPQHPRAEYYIGASYFKLADGIHVPPSIADANYIKAVNERNRFYTFARPYLEAYRKSAPEAVDLWAPLLYEIYLCLNLGPEFEEISKYYIK